MEQQTISGKGKIILTIVGIIAFTGLAFLLVKSDKSPESQYAETLKKDEVMLDEIKSTEIPANIPNNLPYINEGVVLQNFSNTLQTGLQSTRRWTIEEKPENLLLVYQDYFKNNNWNVVSTYDTKNLYIVGVIKEGLSLSLSISGELSSTQSIIEITTNKSLATD